MVSASESTVRVARQDDLPAILALLFQLAGGSRHPEAAVRDIDPHHRATVRRLLDNPDYHPAILEHVVIDQTARGSGFGQLLLGEAVRLAKDAGCYKLSLTSGLQREEAHRFYERIGFQNRSKGFSIYFI